MKHLLPLFMVLLAALAGCGGDSASYLVDGNRENAFSLFRDKSYPGADWELALVLTHMPECQRRHRLQRAPGGQPYKAELYRTAKGSYLLHSAETWYEAQLDGCVLQELKSLPASSGALVGTWEARDGGFKFFPAKK